MHVLRRMLVSQRGQWRSQVFPKRQCSKALVPMSEIIEKRNYLFSEEQKRQLEEVGRVTEMAVKVCGPPEDTVLIMNRNISTPYDCCKHISLPLCERSPLALIDDKILWDMHRPLPGDCKIKFLSFKDKDPYSLNETFWRTGSFILGAVVTKAFKDDIRLNLHRFPECRLNTCSFIYDVMMDLPGWEPTVDELKVLSAEFLSLTFQKLKIERLSVKKSMALKIFEENPYKINEISKHASDSGDNLVTLYRVGDHIDLASGPMVGDTSFFGRSTVTAVHSVYSDDSKHLYRFQAVSLPKGIMLNQFAYSILTQRGAILNEIHVPELPEFFQFYSKHCMKNSKIPITTNPLSYNC